MRRSTILSLTAALLALLATDQAIGQGTVCPNGMCPTSSGVAWGTKYSQLQDGGALAKKILQMEPMDKKLAPTTDLEKKIVQMEKDALDKWYAGDPSAYVAMLDTDVGYFEPGLEKRLDGKVPLTTMFEALREKIHADQYHMLNTRVQASENMATLSFNLLAVEHGIPFRWNCTEVFALNKAGQWKLIHSHWSRTTPRE